MAGNVVGHRSRYVSHIQKKLILKFLESNPELLSPKFSINFKFRDAQIKWTEMANMLNRVPGSKKDWRQWRKTWHDMRSKTKLKLLQGNSVFSKIEHEILRIIGEVPVKDGAIVYEEIDIKNEVSEDDSSTEVNLDQFLTANKDPLDTVADNNMRNVIIEMLPSEVEPNAEEEMIENSRMLEDPKSKGELTDVFVKNTFHGGADRKSLVHKRSYYDRKLMVLNRIARAKEKSAAAKERIAAALEKIADSRVDVSTTSSSSPTPTNQDAFFVAR